MAGVAVELAARMVLKIAPARTFAPLAASSPTLWYVTRATATAAYVLLTVTVILGMLRSIGRQASERVSWIVDELHQITATLTGVLILAHIVTLILDPFLPFSVLNVLVPLAEPYRPTSVRFGVVALYLMFLVLVSSWIRRRMSYRLWRGVHYFALLGFALVTAHGFLAGSDKDEPWMRAIYAGAAAAVAFLLLVRVFAGPAASYEATEAR